MVQQGEDQHDEAGEATVAVFIQVVLLGVVLATGHTLSRWGVRWIGDAGVALALGAAASAALSMLGSAAAAAFSPFLTFNQEFFFVVLLPFIIFQAGYSLDTESFFANLYAISAYAFAGTSISTGVIGLVVWLAGAAGLCTQFSGLEALLFGAVVSATDPVTVLAVFERLHADPNLYALVFGESMLNDAVAIVLFRVLAGFLHTPVTAVAVLRAVGTFLLVFFGSLALGAAVACLASLLIKTKRFRSEHLPREACLVVLLAYASYLLADALRLSGIVSVLYSGVVMAPKPNLTRASHEQSGAFFKIVAVLAETFVFCYIGSSALMPQQGWEHGRLAPLVAVALVALALSRAANIWPLSAAINYLRAPEARISAGQQFMLWWAGLRGAMAFALALQAADTLPDGRGKLMLTCVYLLVFITVLVNGGACEHLLTRLGLRAAEHPAPPSPSSGYQHLNLCGNEDEGSEALIPVHPSPTWGQGPHEQTLASSGRPGKGILQPQVKGKLVHHPVPAPPSLLERLRGANRSGVLLARLNRLDQRYLGRIFLATATEPEVELPQVAHADVEGGEGQLQRGEQHGQYTAAPSESPAPPSHS